MEINLKSYYMMFKKRLWIVALCAAIFVLPTALLAKDTYYPIYQASTDLLINYSSGQQSQIDYSAVSVIIKTPAIMDTVIQWYPDLDLTADQLSAAIHVTNVSGSRLMRIIAQDASYEKAAKIANYVTQVVRTEIPKLFLVDSVTVLNLAKLIDNPKPVNSQSNRHLKLVVLSMIASLAISVGIIFLLDSLDDTLKTEDDVRSIFEKATLAVVPIMKEKELRLADQKKVSRKRKGGAPYAARSQS